MESASALPTATSPQLDVRPLSEHIGAELHNFDLRSVLSDRWARLQVRDALARHLVLRVRGQDLDADELMSLCSVWGPLMDVRHAGNGALHVPGNDFIKVISNARTRDGRRVGDGNSAGQIWHSDATYWEAPPGVTLFCGKVAPAALPRTYFLDMIKVYAALADELKREIRDVRVQHHQYPRGVEIGDNPTQATLSVEKRSRGAIHPLVRRHLASNRPALYLPYRRDCLIPGMDEARARDLLERLWAFTDRCNFHHGVALEPGDVVIWDNTAVLHRRDSWPATQARVMWHISAQGEVPTPMYTRIDVNENALGFDGKGDTSYIADLQAVLP
ncbi:MAG: TauD/TfdA family dioxygenase [Burkholderiaceae bacterium]|nr:TauD/TfdA family dioxygenase [Burkholderiaceae bacterium]